MAGRNQNLREEDWVSVALHLNRAMDCYCLLLLLSFSVFFPPRLVNAKTYRNVSLGSSFAAGSRDSAWLSPSGVFAVGFHPLNDTGLFLLAIWIDKLRDKTVIWSANGDAPVRTGSKFEVTKSGRLLLTDDRGGEVWKKEAVNGSVAYAAMLDSGNFALVSSTFNNLWESFDEPTDTILPEQTFNRGGVLTCRRSETNFARGKFGLSLQTDGNLVLYPVSSQDQAYPAFWVSDTIGSGSQLILPKSGYLYILAANRTRLNLASGNGLARLTEDLFLRATLDYDGVLRQYVHPRNPANRGNWQWAWTPVLHLPLDICSRGFNVGGGVCGFNSLCKQDADRPACSCPSGYSYLQPGDSFSGCKPNFSLPIGCHSAELQPAFEMIEIPNADFGGFEYEHYTSMNDSSCSDACFQDCQCGLAVYWNGDCWPKRFPFSNGRQSSNFSGKVFIKVGKDDSSSSPPPSSSQSKSGGDKVKVLVWVLFGSSAGLNCILLSAVVLGVFLFSKTRPRKASPQPDYSSACLTRFTYEELEKATSGFRQVLGAGNSGTVYKGVLTSPANSAKLVAVKELHKLPKQKDQEFGNEISAISRVHHKNLVPLLGYCDEGPHRLLVYEYMSNGSLADHLFASPAPSWSQRIQIAFGVARGVLYLHEECETQIIHCDIKPQNVLLNDDFVPRISDFGLSKLLNANQTRTTTNIRGTRGYVAPEWFKTVPVTLKVDVFSFGVLLLEIICCRRNVKTEVDEEEAPDILTNWAFDFYREGRLNELVADDGEALNDGTMVERLLKVAIWCIQQDPSLRPSMRKVTQMLEGAEPVPPPPDPSSRASSLA